MGGSKMFIEVGKKVSVLDLLKGIMIQSGNDASVAIAEYVGGTEDGFVDLMNAYAGCNWDEQFLFCKLNRASK
jgi:D-alanyl-D-alanine carboxypeptidase (penicillin-binding protein 5/6)